MRVKALREFTYYECYCNALGTPIWETLTLCMLIWLYQKRVCECIIAFHIRCKLFVSLLLYLCHLNLKKCPSFTSRKHQSYDNPLFLVCSIFLGLHSIQFPSANEQQKKWIGNNAPEWWRWFKCHSICMRRCRKWQPRQRHDMFLSMIYFCRNW